MRCFQVRNSFVIVLLTKLSSFTVEHLMKTRDEAVYSHRRNSVVRLQLPLYCIALFISLFSSSPIFVLTLRGYRMSDTLLSNSIPQAPIMVATIRPPAPTKRRIEVDQLPQAHIQVSMMITTSRSIPATSILATPPLSPVREFIHITY